MNYTYEELVEIWNDMVRIHGDRLPDFDHCPKEFAYLLKLYMYDRKMKNEKFNSNPQG